MTQLINDLESTIEPLVKSAGATLYACQFTHSDGVASLHIMVDKEGGVDVQTCADISRTVKLVLEVEYPKILEKYQLVVSSPGIERPLISLKHFNDAVGEQVSITLTKARNSIKRYTGLVQKVDGENVIIDSDLGEQTFTLNDIAKAKILWNQGAKK